MANHGTPWHFITLHTTSQHFRSLTNSCSYCFFVFNKITIMQNNFSWFMWTPWFLEMKLPMCEGLWRAMEGYEGLWRVMKVYERLWRDMKGYRGLWRSIKGYEWLWRAMKVYEGLWSAMMVLGGFNVSMWGCFDVFVYDGLWWYMEDFQEHEG